MEKLDDFDLVRLKYVDMLAETVPKPETRLWRFMDLAKFVSMLDREALYFPCLAALGEKDTLEAAPPRLPPTGTPRDKWDAWTKWRYHRAVTFVNCWHASPDESAAMWVLYAQQGLALDTTFGRLSEAINQGPSTADLDRRVFGGTVRYVDPDEEALPEHVSNIVTEALRKRWWYEYEHEVRLVYMLGSNYIPDPSGSGLGMTKNKGRYVSCDLRTAVSAVVLAPHTPPFFEAAVKAICRRFGFDLKVKRSRMEEGAPTPPDPAELAECLNTPAPRPQLPEPDSDGL